MNFEIFKYTPKPGGPSIGVRINAGPGEAYDRKARALIAEQLKKHGVPLNPNVPIDEFPFNLEKHARVEVETDSVRIGCAVLRYYGKLAQPVVDEDEEL
jgi:hypothetical protein